MREGDVCNVCDLLTLYPMVYILGLYLSFLIHQTTPSTSPTRLNTFKPFKSLEQSDHDAQLRPKRGQYWILAILRFTTKARCRVKLPSRRVFSNHGRR
jgi:hypothetical protein